LLTPEDRRDRPKESADVFDENAYNQHAGAPALLMQIKGRRIRPGNFGFRAARTPRCVQHRLSQTIIREA
jgi:hypothetical protein